MIVYALIIRTNDGLPLSASTDFNHEINRNIKENKRYVKMVGNKANQLKESCVLQLKDFTIFMVSALGVSYLVMTEFHYPTTLAFSFLKELMKEFARTYDMAAINSAKRPFHFIEFDSFIHKTRQAYNKPQSLASRVNLVDLTTELSLRPPLKLAVTDIEPIINGGRYLNIPQMGVGPPPKLQSLSWPGSIALLLSILLILLGVYRGFIVLHMASFEVYGAISPIHGGGYLLEASLRSFQVYLLLYHSRRRILFSWLTVFSLFGCIFFLWEFRNHFQHSVFAFAALTTHIFTIMRSFEPRLPDYHV